MTIGIDDAKAVLERLGAGKTLTLCADAFDGKNAKALPKGASVDRDTLTALMRNNAGALDVVYSRELLLQLHKTNPSVYRLPYAVEPVSVIGKLTRTFALISKQNQRKRYLILAEDIYRNPEKKDYHPIARYGEAISEDYFNEIKASLHPSRRYAYRPNEYGIIVLIDLRPKGEDYLKRFYKNSELVTALLGQRTEGAIPGVSPDMTPSVDVHPVDNYRELLDTYIQTNARLIVVGDALAPEYKKALGDVKRYDRYARFMLASNIDHNDIAGFFKQVRLNYHRNPWQQAK